MATSCLLWDDLAESGPSQQHILREPELGSTDQLRDLWR